MTIGIVGSRRRNSTEDEKAVFKAFQSVYQKGDWIVSGGCPKGADSFAEDIAQEYGITITTYYPRKEDLNLVLLKKNPRAAWAVINYARNGLIAKDADVLIACVAPDRKGGTEDTIRRFQKFHPDAGKAHLILV